MHLSKDFIFYSTWSKIITLELRVGKYDFFSLQQSQKWLNFYSNIFTNQRRLSRFFELGVFSAVKTYHVTQERYKRVLLNIYKFIYRCSRSELIYKLHIPLKTLYIRRCLVCKSCHKVSFNTSIFSLHKFRKNVPLNACPWAIASFIY